MMNIAMPSDLDAASAFRYPAVFQNNIQVAETSTICRNTTLAAYISLYIYILRFAWNFKSYRVPGIRSLLGPPAQFPLLAFDNRVDQSEKKTSDRFFSRGP